MSLVLVKYDHLQIPAAQIKQQKSRMRCVNLFRQKRFQINVELIFDIMKRSVIYRYRLFQIVGPARPPNSRLILELGVRKTIALVVILLLQIL